MSRYRDTSDEVFRDRDGIVHRFVLVDILDQDGYGNPVYEEETFCDRNISEPHNGGRFFAPTYDPVPRVTCLRCLSRSW